MIAAQVQPWLARLMAGHAQRRIRARFGRLRVRGLDALRGVAAARPVLFVANHSAWWDAMLALWLSRRALELDAYAMMDAQHLRRRPFLGRVGAFGVELGSRRDGAAGIAYAASKLQGAGQCVWLFPQGEERPWHESPLAFRPGASRIARLAQGAAVVPVSFAYTFGANESPDAWIAVGAPLASRLTAAMREGVEAQRAAIIGALEGAAGDFEDVVVRRQRPVGVVAERVLAAVSRLGFRDEPTSTADGQRALAPRHTAAPHRSE